LIGIKGELSEPIKIVDRQRLDRSQLPQNFLPGFSGLFNAALCSLVASLAADIRIEVLAVTGRQ
jgi:hypothetical protein